MNNKKKLLIFYDWFYPGFRAGGPIQSLTNLAMTLSAQRDVYLVTGASDLNCTKHYPGVKVDGWNEILFPGAVGSIQVFYATNKSVHKQCLISLLKEICPDVVYLNGIYSYRFFLLPLMAMTKINHAFRTIICPRGMLQKGALQGKTFKKRLYLRYLQLSGLVSRVCWHATTAEEANDIKLHFATNRGILVAANIPKQPLSEITIINKTSGRLKLVYLSLINQHKNLQLVLQLLLANSNPDVTLDIYGPVVDAGYWNSCKTILTELSDRVHYKGEVEPLAVQEVLSGYHGLILLTKGENFGHALYEGLSVGRPVITSYFTPWQNLYQQSAGINMDIGDRQDCLRKLNLFVEMDQLTYNRFCKGAYTLAEEYYKNVQPVEKYNELFGV